MNNQTILIGRIINDPQIFETKENVKCCITLAVPRNFKNLDGIYETDFIPCILLNNMAESVFEWCKKGDLVGVRARLAKLGKEENLQVLADKVTFLSSRKETEEE